MVVTGGTRSVGGATGTGGQIGIGDYTSIEPCMFPTDYCAGLDQLSDPNAQVHFKDGFDAARGGQGGEGGQGGAGSLPCPGASELEWPNEVPGCSYTPCSEQPHVKAGKCCYFVNVQCILD
jgi:hypothetical protein